MRLPASHEKIITPQALLERMRLLQLRRETMVVTNGAFRLLHFGHTTTIEYASHQGDWLAVLVNSDRSLRKLGRKPLQGENQRAHAVAAMGCVDAVVLFQDPTPYALLRLLRPHVLVKGGDYRNRTVVGAEFAGRVALAPEVPDLHVSECMSR